MADNIGETTAVSWLAPASMTYEEWEKIGRTLQQLGRSLNWWLGDWLNTGEQRWGEMYSQALEITGLSVETLSKYKRVAARVPADIRRPDLTWTHHFAVAYAEEGNRGPLLEIAAHFEISSRDLKELMRLSPAQQNTLITLYDQGEYMSLTDFNKGVNQIRLTVAERGTVNGQALPMKDYEADTDVLEEDEEEEVPWQQGALTDDDAADDEEQVYTEEIMQFFDVENTKMVHCTYNEAAWNGLFVFAALDEKGKPYLKWGVPGRFKGEAHAQRNAR